MLREAGEEGLAWGGEKSVRGSSLLLTWSKSLPMSIVKLTFIVAILNFFTTPESAAMKTIHLNTEVSYEKKWIKLDFTASESIRKLLYMLLETKMGKKIVHQAQKKAAERGLTLLDVIQEGEGSLTDTTLIRKFSPNRPENVVYEARSVVYLNRELSVADGLLDLAHELTHFAYKAPFNPYQSQFNAIDFVNSTVDGRGGEVDAFLVECRVYFELQRKMPSTKNQCEKIFDPKRQSPSRQLTLKEFFKLGSFHQEFVGLLKNYHQGGPPFVELSQEEGSLISSAYGLPYPLAALKEYELILNKVCENDRKRLVLLKQRVLSAGVKRSPASEIPGQYEKIQNIFQQRCIQRGDRQQKISL